MNKLYKNWLFLFTISTIAIFMGIMIGDNTTNNNMEILSHFLVGASTVILLISYFKLMDTKYE